MELEATGLLTQDTGTHGTSLVDACNFFKNMIRLVMICTVHHHYTEG